MEALVIGLGVIVFVMVGALVSVITENTRLRNALESDDAAALVLYAETTLCYPQHEAGVFTSWKIQGHGLTLEGQDFWALVRQHRAAVEAIRAQQEEEVSA